MIPQFTGAVASEIRIPVKSEMRIPTMSEMRTPVPCLVCCEHGLVVIGAKSLMSTPAFAIVEPKVKMPANAIVVNRFFIFLFS